MKVTKGLMIIISIFSAIFLILQILLAGSTAFIRPSYTPNMSYNLGPPPSFDTKFNISNPGLFSIYNFQINIQIYNASGTILQGGSVPTTTTISAFSQAEITINLINISGSITDITDGLYDFYALVTGAFIWSLTSFKITLNDTYSLIFPPIPP